MNQRKAVQQVLRTIEERSYDTRERYLEGIREMADASDSDRGQVGCSNLAHAAAGASDDQSKLLLVDNERPKNLAIVTAYNDMLSAHQPYENYPVRIKQKARLLGSMAQVAGGVPAMCDGVTQGRPGWSSRYSLVTLLLYPPPSLSVTTSMTQRSVSGSVTRLFLVC